jgi:iron(III) transport system permease protein
MILIFDKNGLSTFRLGCERHRLSEKTHPPRAVRRPARVNGKTHNAKPMPLLITVLLALTALPLALLLLAGVLGLMGAQVCPLGCAWLPAFIQAMLANADSVGLSAVLTSSIADSALLSLSVVTIALLLGAALAWLTSQYDFAGRRAFEVLLITPIALPAYVAAYAWVELLAYDAPLASSFRAVGLLNRLPDIRNAAGAALVLGLSLMPYIYTLARVAFAQQAARMGEVAASLGVSRVQALRRVYLPLAWPALAAGASLVLMESLADYGVASYMGVSTLTVTVYKTWFAGEQKLTAIALVLCLVLACASLLWLERRWRGQAAKFQTQGAVQTNTRQRLNSAPAVAAFAACAIVTALGFFIPLGSLLWLWLREAMPLNAARLLPAIWHSVQLATLGAACVLALASAALLVQRLHFKPKRLLNGLIQTNQLGYAIPGVAIALAILWPVAALDKAVASWFGTELWIASSIAGVVLAYVIRFYAVGHHSVQQGLTRITPHMQDAAASLGATRWQTVRRVYAPLLTPTFASAWVLVWIDCLKELPATLMLRPFNSDTLPVLVFQFISDERPAAAALPSLLLVLVGLIPVMIVARRR